MDRPDSWLAADDALLTAWSITTLIFAALGAGVWALA